MMSLCKKVLIAAVLFPIAFSACKDHGSITNLYKFPSTKNVRVQITIDLKLAPGTGPALGLTNNQFLLNAYTLDDAGEEVALSPDGQAPVVDLPVTMPGPQLTFIAAIQVPVSVQPRASGYAFRFSLRPASALLRLAGSPSVNLTALTNSIQAGAEPALNQIDISVAS